MTSHPNWTELLARLEFDLQARAADQTAATDEEAWRTMAQVLWSRARVLAFSYSGLQPADVQDLVQSVLLKLQSTTTMRRLRAARSIEGYLFVMLRNAANDLVRRRQLERTLFRSLEEQEPEDRPVLQPKYVKNAEDVSVLGNALESLNNDDRQLLQMRFWRNMSIAEIAIETRTSYSTTAVRLFRILYRLRVQLRK
jgi:RNA polymerase sigma factor (sigma-70 family)